MDTATTAQLSTGDRSATTSIVRTHPIAGGQSGIVTSGPANMGTSGGGAGNLLQNFAIGIAIGIVVMLLGLVSFFAWRRWKKKQKEKAHLSQPAFQASPSSSPLTRVRSFLHRASTKTTTTTAHSSPTPLHRIRSMLSRGSTDSGRTDLTNPSLQASLSSAALQSAIATAGNHASVVVDTNVESNNAAVAVATTAAGGGGGGVCGVTDGIEEGLYSVKYTSERVYVDPDQCPAIEKRLSKSDSWLFDRESTLYMTNSVQAAQHDMTNSSMKSGSSLPDLLAIPADANREGQYAKLSSNVGVQSPAKQRQSIVRAKRAATVHNRSSLPSSRFLHAAAVAAHQPGSGAAKTGDAGAENGGYAKAVSSNKSPYQALLKVQKSSPVLLVSPSKSATSATTANTSAMHTSVLSNDGYEVQSPSSSLTQATTSTSPGNSGRLTYLSFTEGAPLKSTGSVSSPDSNKQDNTPADTGVSELLKQLSITTVSEEEPSVESSAAGPRQGLTSVPRYKVPRGIPLPASVKQAANNTAAPVPPPRRDSVLRSRALQERRRMNSIDCMQSNKTVQSAGMTENHRNSMSCPDILAATASDADDNCRLQPARTQTTSQTTSAPDSGVDAGKTPPGQDRFIDPIREYRQQMPVIGPLPSDDYWTGPAAGGGSTTSSLSSHSSPLKATSGIGVHQTESTTLPPGVRPSLPPKPDKNTIAAARRRAGTVASSHLAVAKPASWRHLPLSSTSSDDADLNAEPRPTVKLPVSNRLLSETSREYWILEGRNGGASSCEDESSFGSPP